MRTLINEMVEHYKRDKKDFIISAILISLTIGGIIFILNL